MKPCVYLLFICCIAVQAFGQNSDISLSLNEAIETGLKNNPHIKAAQAKIAASQGRRLSALSPAPADFSVTHDYIPAGKNISRYGERTIGISQSIDFPTTYVHRNTKFSIEKNIAVHERAQYEREVIATVKKAYFTMLAVQAQTKLAQENCAIAEEFFKKAEIRHSVGEGSNLEKLTAKATYSEAQNAVELQNNYLVSACADLNVALGYGKEDSKAFRLTDTLSFYAFDVSLGELIDDADTTNPLLQISKLRVDSYAAEKSLAWSALLPNFNVGYFNKKVRDDATSYYGASFGMSIPLWFMLDQRGKIKEASANMTTAKNELQTAHNEVYAKIQTAFAEFLYEKKQIELYEKDLLPQATEIFATADKSYRAGEITYIEFLLAQQTLRQSRGNYVTALLAYNLSIVALEEALGKSLLTSGEHHD